MLYICNIDEINEQNILHQLEKCFGLQSCCTSGNSLYYAEIQGLNVCFLIVLSLKIPQQSPGKVTLLMCLKEIQHQFLAQYLVTLSPISPGTGEMAQRLAL